MAEGKTGEEGRASRNHFETHGDFSESIHECISVTFIQSKM
jgi:hypothetical protein